jgi:hypothetical protein
MKYIIDYFLPGWKVTSTHLVECEVESILFRREWKETRVVQIETSRAGRKRSFFVNEHGKKPVEYAFICGMMGKPL